MLGSSLTPERVPKIVSKLVQSNSAVTWGPYGRPHLNQFEECKTSLREGPRGLQGAPGSSGPQGALTPPPPWCPLGPLGPSLKLVLHSSNWLR